MIGIDDNAICCVRQNTRCTHTIYKCEKWNAVTENNALLLYNCKHWGGITHSRCGMRPNNEFHFTPIWTIIKAKSKLCCWYNNAATQFSKQPNYIWFRCTPYFVWYGDNKYIAMHFLGGSTLEDKRNNARRNIEHIGILKCWHILNNSELEIFSFPFPICSIHLWNDKFNLEHLNQS